jgi:hypothetical protein
MVPPQQSEILPENAAAVSPHDVAAGGMGPPEAYQHGYIPSAGYMDGKRHSMINQPLLTSEEQQQQYHNRRRRTTQFESVRGGSSYATGQYADPSQGGPPSYSQPAPPYSMPEVGYHQGKERRHSDVSGAQRSPFVPRHRQGSTIKPTPEIPATTDPNDPSNHKESN